MMKKAILAALAAVTIASCAEQESFDGAADGAQEIKFTSGIASRVSDSQWEAGDLIGTYIYCDDLEEYTTSNVSYTALLGGSSTSFTATSGDQSLYFPTDVESVNYTISAYYPYDASHSTGDDYIFDITDQSDTGAIDYLVASSTLNSADSYTDNAVELNFEHQQALVKFNFAIKGNVESIEGLSFALSNIQTKGLPGVAPTSDSSVEYGTIASAIVEFADDNTSATSEMILFPSSLTDATLWVSVNSTTYSAPFATVLTAAKQHNFLISVGADSITIGDSEITPWGDDIADEELPAAYPSYAEMTFTEFLALTSADLLPEEDTWLITGSHSVTNVFNYIAKVDTALESADRQVALIFSDWAALEYYAFQLTSTFTSVAALEALTVAECAFNLCSSVTTIYLPKVTTLESAAIGYCSSVTNIYLPMATTIGSNAFRECTGLTSLSLPSATDIGNSAFNGCTSLTALSLPLVANIGNYAFYNCTSLTSLSLPSATVLGNQVFYNDSALTSLEIATGSGVKLSSIGSLLFSNSNNLNIDLTLGAANAEYVTGSTLKVGSYSYTFKSITLLEE